MNIQTFFTEEIKNYLYSIKDYYYLTNYEYVELITLILTNGVITHNKSTINDIDYFVNLILYNRQNTIINDNSYVYNNSIKYIITNYFEQNGISQKTFNEIINNWFNGYFFHSLNNSFVSDININGFVLENKPWDIQDIKIMKSIFKGKRDIFGLSNGEDNIIFLSTNLKSSPYYGLTSPTFYRKFIENDPKYLNVFLNRDLKCATKSIDNLCNQYNLTVQERKIVLDFFKKYWIKYATDDLPSIILIKRTDNKDIPYPTDNIVNSTINLITKDTHTKIIRNNIDRDNLILFDCNSLDIIKQSKKSLD